jgi:hypothetical protein
MHEFSNTIAGADEPLAGRQLRELRILAGFSKLTLEKCARLSHGRLAKVESGRARFRPWEAATVRRLLVEEMAARAAEIAEHLQSVEPASPEGRESSP